MSVLLLLAALAADVPFPERTPGMIESCIIDALASDNMSK